MLWNQDVWADFFPAFTLPAPGSNFFAVDVQDTEDGLLLEADLPGLAQADVQVQVHEGVLTITAERKGSDKPGLRRERNFGSFQRSFQLAKNIDVEGIEAQMANGVLSLRLRRKPETKPRLIEVRG